MGVPLKKMMDRFAALEKAALEKIAEDPTGTENSAELTGVPGAEKDKAVPEAAKKPDEEVAQGQPAGAASTEGAVVGGDAKPLNEGKLEFDQPVLNPDEKAMETSDALTAKTASLVSDILKDLNSKQAESCGAKATAAKPADAKKEVKQEAKKEAGAKNKIEIGADMISKLAAAVSAYNKGKEAAMQVSSGVNKQAAAQDAADERRGMLDAIKYFAGLKKQASVAANDAEDERRGMVDCLKTIKQACYKIAQDAGLPPEAAEAVAQQAMEQGLGGAEAPAAGVNTDVSAEVPAATEGAAPAAEGDAGAIDQIANALPDDVTEEELGEAIVDLIQSGEIPPEAAKEIVDAIADNGEGAAGEAAPTEDDVANIIAEGINSGEITPEDAESIVNELTGGAPADEANAAEDAAMSDADAAAAQGAADVDEAVKAASAEMAAINDNPRSRLMNKVAGIVAYKRHVQGKYEEGFKKRAEELGVNPQKLAQYILAKQAQAAQVQQNKQGK